MGKLEWTQYNEMDKYAEATRCLLLRSKYQNSIILNNMERRKGQTVGDDFRLATVSKNGKVVLTVWQNLPHQMLYYFTDDKFEDDVMDFFVKNLVANKWDIKQFMGEEVSSKEFAKAYASKTKKSFKNERNLIVYRLEKLSDVKMPSGQFRQCDFKDMNYLPYWAQAFNTELNLDDFNLMEQYKNIFDKMGVYYVWETDTPVALANAQRVSDDCMKIGLVYTPPFFRGKKYATAVVWTICKEFMKKYSDIMLFCDADNPITNKCYQNVGFKKLCISSQYVFE
jgi:hypothetical protein